MNHVDLEALQALVARQAELIERLTARVETLEARPSDGTSVTSTATLPAAAPTSEVEDSGTSRRGFLRLAGVAAAGAAAVVAGSALPAAAADNQSILQGTVGNANNTSGSMTTLTSNGASGLTNAAFKAVGPVDSVGLWGEANGASIPQSSTAVGVYGKTDKGYGVIGESGSGLDLFAGGTGRLAFRPTVISGPPTSGTHLPGEIVVSGVDPAGVPDNIDGTLWVCVTGGTPGKWRKLGGPSSAGAVHLIAPTRVYDSRSVSKLAGGGGSRLVTVVGGTVPSGIRGVVATLTLTGTQTSSGFLAIAAGDVATTGSSSINWFGANQNLATTVVSAVDTQGRVKLFNNSSVGADTDFLLDITGYFL